jgi:hypothetical protein
LEPVRKALEDAYDIDQPLRAALYDFGSLQLASQSQDHE